MKGVDAEIDRLYQLPLDEFTGERNGLAKRAGADGPRVRDLSKPPVPAWAVNQLYWQNRGEWDALVAASENLRRAHKAVLAGRHGDVRAAGKVHDEAVESAMKATFEIVARSPHPLTDTTRQGIANTLRALPAPDVQPGRLAKTLQPGGFEMLAGLTIGHVRNASIRHAGNAASRAAKSAAPQARAREPQSKAVAQAVAAARQEVASSEHAQRDAEQALRREEFESARATREERRAADAVEKARAAVEEVKAELERAEASLREAREKREESERGIPKARAAVTAADKRAQAAATALRKLTGG
jgi:hypothetical protein